MKVLILGGYGTFGGRLAEMLSDIETLELLICGRSAERAKAFCDAFKGKTKVIPLQLDRKDIGLTLKREMPDIVVDASGPFQDYGDNRYSVIDSCIASRVNYLDLADAADFVFGVSKFDDAAKAAGVFILSGVSSYPVLSSAVLQEMSKDMEVVSVRGGVAPSPHAGIGLNVMRAILSYAGKEIKLQRSGHQTTATALAETMRYTIAVPGKLPMHNRHFSLVDVPDLQTNPVKFESLEDIWMGAGPLPEFLHRGLNLYAKLRGPLRLPSLMGLAGVFHKMLNLSKFGEHRGGMFLEARGIHDNRQVVRTWHLLAEGDTGPYIPSMAAEAIVRKCVVGVNPPSGAGAGELKLEDYEPAFQRRAICTGFRDEEGKDQPLYRQILGPAFENLPDKVQSIHDSVQTRRWAGVAETTQGTGLLARGIAKVIGFPRSASSIPVRVEMACQNGGELWTRDFDGKTFSSFQSAGTGRSQYLLDERFGLITVALALVIEKDRLFLIPRRWSLLGIPLPGFLLPAGRSFETQKDGDFCFDVEIAVPFVGLIVSYKGRLQPE